MKYVVLPSSSAENVTGRILPIVFASAGSLSHAAFTAAPGISVLGGARRIRATSLAVGRAAAALADCAVASAVDSICS
jgi:hypothetical protein